MCCFPTFCSDNLDLLWVWGGETVAHPKLLWWHDWTAFFCSSQMAFSFFFPKENVRNFFTAQLPSPCKDGVIFLESDCVCICHHRLKLSLEKLVWTLCRIYDLGFQLYFHKLNQFDVVVSICLFENTFPCFWVLTLDCRVPNFGCGLICENQKKRKEVFWTTGEGDCWLATEIRKLSKTSCDKIRPSAVFVFFFFFGGGSTFALRTRANIGRGVFLYQFFLFWTQPQTSLFSFMRES